MHTAASFMAYAANTSLEKVAFDYRTLTEPLEPHHIEARFTWLAFKDSDLRDIEARDGLAPGDANLILEALAKTPIYTGSNLGETFVQVASAPRGAPAGLDVRLARKCYSVLYMLSATWLMERHERVAKCRCCDGRYTVDVPRGFVNPQFTCWKCRKAGIQPRK